MAEEVFRIYTKRSFLVIAGWPARRWKHDETNRMGPDANERVRSDGNDRWRQINLTLEIRPKWHPIEQCLRRIEGARIEMPLVPFRDRVDAVDGSHEAADRRLL